jgi:hypothetical protein
MRTYPAILVVLIALVGGCVATEYVPPTLISLPTATVTPPVSTTPTATLPAVAVAIEPSPPPSETPHVVVIDTPTAEQLSRALIVPPGADIPPIAALATLPGAQAGAVLPAAAPSITPQVLILPTAVPTQAALGVIAPTPVPTQIALLSEGAALDPALRAVESGLDAQRGLLRAVPILTGFDTPQVREIIARGRSLGNRANVFTVVGDSNSVSGDFLRPLVLDNYCAWGGYSPLQEAVRFYNVSPDGTARSSFSRQSITTQMGFNSAAARDPFWANNPRCNRGESPLTCEVRVAQPAAAIIMLGGKDVSRMSIDTYRYNMGALVDELIGAGVVPVLTTFVVLPERDVYPASLAFNAALIEIAAARGTPLVNLWAAAETLPDHGIAADRTHLRTQPGRFCDFDGGERIYGGTLRNLLTLSALDLLRRMF